MEPLLAFIVDFFWIAPAAAGAGAVVYGAATAKPRRARRLELDAARYEEQTAHRALLSSRAHVRGAQARVQTAQAHRRALTPGIPTVTEAKRDLQEARRAQKNASLLLRAARTRVKAVQTHLRATGRDAPLPLERLMAEHDEVTARWLTYETDAVRALAYPQMSDARQPATFAFLRAQSDAGRRRPASSSAAVKPEEFVAYRASVIVLQDAFRRAEDAARHAASGTSGQDRFRGIWPVPGWSPIRPVEDRPRGDRPNM